MATVCIVTLCGLPAAGKTTFATLFADYVQQLDSSSAQESCLAEDRKSTSSRHRVIHIDYDKLIPSEVATSLSDDNEQCVVSQWKLYRKAIFRCIDSFLARLCGQPLDGAVDDVSEMSTDIIHNNVSPVFSELYNALCTAQQHGTDILIIDDNMYYASMRYQLYQLARKYSTGYAQIYFPVEVNEALERNSRRDFPVADNVIVSMSSKMDVPSSQNIWEALTTEWNASDYSQKNFDKVIAMIEECLHNPVMSAAGSLESEREESRSVCSKNIYHQSDIILRHLLNDFVTMLKAEVTDTVEISQRAKQANSVRQRILEELRQNKLIIPRASIDCLRMDEMLPTSTDHPLYIFIKQVFTDRLSKPS